MIIQDEIDFFSNLKSTYSQACLQCKWTYRGSRKETEIFDGIHIAHTISIIDGSWERLLSIEALSQERPL